MCEEKNVKNINIQRLPDLVFQQLFDYLPLASCLLLTSTSNTLYNSRCNLSKPRILLSCNSYNKLVNESTSLIKLLLQHNELELTKFYIQEFVLSNKIDCFDPSVPVREYWNDGFDALICFLEQYVLRNKVSEEVREHLIAIMDYRTPSDKQYLKLAHLVFHSTESSMFRLGVRSHILHSINLLELEVRTEMLVYMRKNINASTIMGVTETNPGGYSVQRLGFGGTELSYAYMWYNIWCNKDIPRTVECRVDGEPCVKRCFRCYPPCDDEEKVLNMYREWLGEID